MTTLVNCSVKFQNNSGVFDVMPNNFDTLIDDLIVAFCTYPIWRLSPAQLWITAFNNAKKTICFFLSQTQYEV